MLYFIHSIRKKRIPSFSLHNNHGHNIIEYFSELDLARSKENKRSTSGYCVFVGRVRNKVLSLDLVQTLNIER